MSLKSVAKQLLPRGVTQTIGNFLVHQRERRLSRLSLQEAFDEVYRKNMWRQGDSSSGVGSEGVLADRYIELVLKYASENGLRTAVDAGCGDFSVGSRLAPHFGRYTAFDLSPFVIENNKRHFATLTRNVTFHVGDMTSTMFPSGDLILIRQVLQHLTNAQIEQILKNLEASEWRRALITEDVHDPENNQTPNLDLPSHTVRTRVSMNSGVFLDKDPFNRDAKRLAVLYGCNGVGNKPFPKDGLLVFELTNKRNLN
jgi:hypothetical protein